jgi:UDP-glucose 4-epimerase
MKIAVTGAGGRVGRAVVELALASGHTVVRIDRRPDGPDSPDSQFVQIDLQDYPALTAALSGCDTLVHLAALTGPGLFPDHVVHNNNVVSSYNALRAAAEVGIGRVCQASSVNAIGGRFSRRPRYDYFPVDEQHRSYAEDPYSLSKWICEQQAFSLTRRFEDLSVASLRLHGVVADRSDTARWIDLPDDAVAKHLWGYTRSDATARACLLALAADFTGHDVFYIVAPDTMMDTPSLDLKQQFYPDVPLRGELPGNRGFFDCRKAQSILGWSHDAG